MIYVTSDLHGCSLEKIERLCDNAGFGSDDFLYILGDVIDRGKDGIEILKWIMSLSNVQLILGNHEAMMLENEFFFEKVAENSVSKFAGINLKAYKEWLMNDGHPTINALSAMKGSEIKSVFEYLHKAPLYRIITLNEKTFILTHSGLGNFRPDKKLTEYTSDELLWIRPKITDKYFDDITTVFGHTPTIYYMNQCKGKILKTDTWIDIDVGVSLGHNPVLLRLDDMKEVYL